MMQKINRGLTIFALVLCLYNPVYASQRPLMGCEKLTKMGVGCTTAGLLGMFLGLGGNEVLVDGGLWLTRAALLPTMVGAAKCVRQSFNTGLSVARRSNLRLVGAAGVACSLFMLGAHLLYQAVDDAYRCPRPQPLAHCCHCCDAGRCHCPQPERQHAFINMFKRNKMAYFGGGALLGAAAYLSARL